jgi:4-hydroxybenzoate polyprenyltransferase
MGFPGMTVQLDACIHPSPLRRAFLRRTERYFMSKPSTSEVMSYAGGMTSIGASLTLTEFGVLVGIVTALLTFVINAIYVYRRDRREQRECDAALAHMDDPPWEDYS